MATNLSFKELFWITILIMKNYENTKIYFVRNILNNEIIKGPNLSPTSPHYVPLPEYVPHAVVGKDNWKAWER